MANDLYPTRVRFTDGQFLQAADLTDEQSYHLLMRWRHNLGLHSWGILAGLEVQPNTLTGLTSTVTVLAGMALDGYGREIVLAQQKPASFPNDYNAVFDVLIRYSRSTDTPAVSGPLSLNRCTPPRYIEQPYVWVVKTSERESSDPARPGEVPEGDLDFTADQLPPEDPTRQWPVLLGRLSFQGKAWVVDPSVRRYAGLVADRIEAPVRIDPSDPTMTLPRTVLVNGSDPGSAYRFAVVSADTNQSANPDVTPPLIGIQSLDGTGAQIEFRSERVSVAADMVFRNGSVMEFQSNPIGSDPHADPVSGSGEWRLYHHFEPPPQIPTPAPASKSPPPPLGFSDELRVTMPASASNRVAIGCFNDKGIFSAVLAVNGDGTVAVYGNLTVQGTITGRIADAPAGQPGAVVLPTPGQLVEAAIPALKQVSDPDQFRRVLEAIASSTAGKGEIELFVPTTPTLTDDDLKLLFARVWGRDRGALIGASTADTSTLTEPLGARAGNFTDFLKALPGTFRPDSGSTPVAPVKVIGEWLFGLKGADADPLSKLDFAKSSDDAIKAFTANSVEWQKALIKHLIADDTVRAEMISELAKDHADEVVKQLLVANANIGPNLKTDADYDLVLKGLITDPARGPAFAKRLLDFGHQLTDPVDLAHDKNPGSDAIGLALQEALSSTPSTTPPDDKARFSRFINYVTKTAKLDALMRNLVFFFKNFTPPPPPTTGPMAGGAGS